VLLDEPPEEEDSLQGPLPTTAAAPAQVSGPQVRGGQGAAAAWEPEPVPDLRRACGPLWVGLGPGPLFPGPPGGLPIISLLSRTPGPGQLLSRTPRPEASIPGGKLREALNHGVAYRVRPG
jgi:hypothetical protein